MYLPTELCFCIWFLCFTWRGRVGLLLLVPATARKAWCNKLLECPLYCWVSEEFVVINNEQEPESRLERADPVLESGAEPVDKDRPLWLWPEDTEDPNREGRKCCLLRTAIEIWIFFSFIWMYPYCGLLAPVGITLNGTKADIPMSVNEVILNRNKFYNFT